MLVIVSVQKSYHHKHRDFLQYIDQHKYNKDTDYAPKWQGDPSHPQEGEEVETRLHLTVK